MNVDLMTASTYAQNEAYLHNLTISSVMYTSTSGISDEASA